MKAQLVTGIVLIVSSVIGLYVIVLAPFTAQSTPVMDRCSEELVRCSPKATPGTTAGGWQGGLGWQVADGNPYHGERSWYDR